MTVARDVSEALKLPRAVFVPWPMGHHFGAPFHCDLQRRVLLEMLDVVAREQRPGTIRDLNIRWGDVRREAKALTSQGQRL